MNQLTVIGNVFVWLVALLHLGFLVLEMWFWTKPLGRKIFGTTAEFAKASYGLAKNQGLYNGFLAAGLFWGLFIGPSLFAYEVKIFFLGCIVIAGVFGAYTVNRRILFVQALPAFIGLVLLCRAYYLVLTSISDPSGL